MYKHVSISFLLILFSTHLLISQNYRDIFYEKLNKSRESAKSYADSLINSKEANIKVFGLAAKGYILTNEKKYNLSEDLLFNAYNLLDTIKNEPLRLEEKLYILNFHSLHLLDIHEVMKAIELINEGLLLSSKIENLKMQIKFENLLGRSYSLSSLDEEAILIGNKTIKTVLSNKDKLDESYYNTYLFYAYLSSGNRAMNFFLKDSLRNKTYLDTVQKHLTSAKSFIKERNITPIIDQKVRIFNLDADILFYKKKYKEAINFYNQSYNIAKNQNLEKVVYQTKYKIAESYYYLNNYIKSKTLFDELSKKDLNQYNLLENSIHIKYYYAKIHNKLGNIQESLKYANAFTNEYKAYHKNRSDLKVNVIKNKDIEAKKELINDLVLANKNTEKFKAYFIIGIVFLVLSILLILKYVKKQKKIFKVKTEKLIKHINTIEKNNIKTTNLKIDENKAKDIILQLLELEKEELFTSQEYSLNMVAKKINHNTSYVSKVINDHWNKSFVEYTNELRINYILTKLKKDSIYQKYTLAYIADSVGYKSLRTFNKHFKRYTKLTPKQYLNFLKTSSLPKK